MDTPDRPALFALLRRVSRSFYLSLRVLPRPLRRPLGLAYLFCRAADTIADTSLIAGPRRSAHLDRYRAAFSAADVSICRTLEDELGPAPADAAEHELLVSLGRCFSELDALPGRDQAHIRALVLTLTQGMQMDLTVFPGTDDGRLGALETREDLDRYTYYVAGCVGEFWTNVCLDHVPSLSGWNAADMAARSVRFGKGLQLTNILRDVAADVAAGRCYLPRTDLAKLGVEPERLRDPASHALVRPLTDELLNLTLEFYRDGWAYVRAIPLREWRLRLACAWPLLIGAATLHRLRGATDLLDPAVRIKLPRPRVYRLMLTSLLTVWSNRALLRQYARLTS